MDNGLLNCIFFVTVSGMNQSMIYQASKEDNGEISYIDEDINIDGGVVLVGEHEGIGFLPNKDWLLDLELNGEYRLVGRRKIGGKQQKVQRLKREYSALSSIRQIF